MSFCSTNRNALRISLIALVSIKYTAFCLVLLTRKIFIAPRIGHGCQNRGQALATGLPECRFQNRTVFSCRTSIVLI